MKLKELTYEIEIPEKVDINVDKFLVSVKGEKGENSRTFHYPSIKILQKENKITLSAKNATKKEKTMMGTYRAHIRNLIKGVDKGFTYKVKVCSGHFPINLTTEDNTIIINNFLGEKIPRKAKILPGVTTKIEGEIISLDGTDKESVSQSSANIELATRITKRDKRVFQDGCYIISKDGKEIK